MTDVAAEGPGALASSRDEQELIWRARAGDHDAYRTLVRRHEEIAFRTAYLIVRSAADAEEVVQEAFIKAHRALGGFRRGSPFRPWLLRIVSNEARNRVRANERRRRVADGIEAPPEGAPSAEARVLAEEERRRLLDAIDALSDADRLAVLARHVLGLSERETAAVLGVPHTVAKMRVHRALKRLRVRMEGTA
ncbi:MAG: RNA polymerase sigma factor [Gaiellaceae bacterium]